MPFGEIRQSLEIDQHHRLVADDPGVVPRGQGRDVAGFAIQLGAVVHLDMQHAGDVVLQMRRLTTRRLGDWLHAGRPSPARLQGRTTDRRTADLDQFQPSVAAGPGGAVAVAFYDRRAACPTDASVLPT